MTQWYIAIENDFEEYLAETKDLGVN